MKKQTNPNIKAHLLRGVFYLLLLVAVCVIPFALGHRASARQSAVANPLLLRSTPVATSPNSDDPVSGTWTNTGSLHTARYYHTATLLPNGMVLVAAGSNSRSAELYDPASGTWAPTGNLNTARLLHTATLLPNGMVLVAGGQGAPASAELYDPASGTWTITGSLTDRRYSHAATLLPDGMVLVAGGVVPGSNIVLASAELYTSAPGAPPSYLGNISTRGFVQTGDNVMIGGFIVQGTERKRVIIRAIGPELGAPPYNVPDALANPTLELHDGTGALIASNNNWATTIIGGIITANQVRDIQASGYAPRDPRESAMIADLPAGNYTAIVRAVNNLTGVALVEVYDLDADANSILGNISSRAFVQTGDNVVIGGFIVQGPQPKRVIIRAIGPELTQYGVPNPLFNPTLELHDGTGALIASNDNWQHTIIGGIITSDQRRDIRNSGYAPGDGRESAIIADLPPGNYTAIVRGVNSMTGVALVEVYDLDTTAFDLVATVPLPTNSQNGVAANAALNKIYASGGASAGQRVVVIDGTTFAASDVGAGSGVSVDPNTNRYWTANVYGGAALVRDGSTNHLVATIPLGFCPIQTAYDSSRNREWVSAQCGAENDPVFAIDAATLNVVAGPIGSGGIMGPIIANGATGRLYLTTSGISKRVDPTTFAVTTNAFGQVMAVNPVTNTLYASSGNNLQIIDGATNPETILTTIALPYGPAIMGVNTALNHLYVANAAASSIEVRNGSSGALIDTFSLERFSAMPGNAMAVDSTRGRVYVIASSPFGPVLFVIKDLTTG
jgi:Galactose oxidase, central domain